MTKPLPGGVAEMYALAALTDDDAGQISTALRKAANEMRHRGHAIGKLVTDDGRCCMYGAVVESTSEKPWSGLAIAALKVYLWHVCLQCQEYARSFSTIRGELDSPDHPGHNQLWLYHWIPGSVHSDDHLMTGTDPDPQRTRMAAQQLDAAADAWDQTMLTSLRDLADQHDSPRRSTPDQS